MFKVWRVTCGSEDLIQYTMSAGSFSGVGGGAGGTSAPPKVLVKIRQNPWKSGKNPWKSGQNIWKPSQCLGKNGAQRLQNHMKTSFF